LSLVAAQLAADHPEQQEFAGQMTYVGEDIESIGQEYLLDYYEYHESTLES
jgi:hypothetical protein